MMHTDQEPEASVLSEVKDNLFKAAESKDELIPFIRKSLLDDTATVALTKALTQKNQQGKSPLHVAAECQDAASFNRLLNLAAEHHVLNSILLMQDENNKNLLHLIAEFQVESEVKNERNVYFPLDELTRLAEEKDITTALFVEDKTGDTALSIIAQKQEERVDYVLESVVNFDLENFHGKLVNAYPDGKIPISILNRYLSILIRSTWLSIPDNIWGNLFDKVDKIALRDALILKNKEGTSLYGFIIHADPDSENVYHKKLLEYVPEVLVKAEVSKAHEIIKIAVKEKESSAIEIFKISMVNLLTELDKFPLYRKNWLGKLFSIPAVNYDELRNLQNLIRDQTQAREITPSNFPIIQIRVYAALTNFRKAVIRNKGEGESRYLTRLDSYINADEHADIKEGMRTTFR